MLGLHAARKNRKRKQPIPHLRSAQCSAGPVNEHEVLALLNKGRAVRHVILHFERQYEVKAMQKVVTVIDGWLRLLHKVVLV